LYREGGPLPDCGVDGGRLPCRLLRHNGVAGLRIDPACAGPKIDPACANPQLDPDCAGPQLDPAGSKMKPASAAPCPPANMPARPPRGMRIADFVCHPAARRAGLSKAHVVALRVFTTQVR
jgi:hypothetical protein